MPAWQQELAVDIGPWEIRTFRVPEAGQAVETDLLEWPLEAESDVSQPVVDPPVHGPDRPAAEEGDPIAGVLG
jgi:hypothetical protein